MRVFLCIALLALPMTVHAQAVVSELLWSGSPVSSADEWVELTSRADDTLSLQGWSLWKRGSDGSMSEMISFPDDAQISPGAFYLIANYDADTSALSIAPDIVSTAVSLSNSKLYLELRNADGEVIDSVDDGVGDPFAGGKNPYASMERIDLDAPGDDPSNWETATVSIGLDEGAEVLGTPGVGRGDGMLEKEVTEDAEVTSAPSETSAPSIRITEALADPMDSSDYEWIELGNLGEQPVDITGWILSDGSRSYAIEPRSADGYVLASQEYAVFFKYQTGLSLSDDDVLTLTNGESEIDSLALSEAGEEVSIGRTDEGKRSPFCVPSPRSPNGKTPLDPYIVVQSGRATDYTRVTLNLNTEVERGSLKSAECLWDFDDGTTSEKCNPPAHTWDYYGVYRPTVRVMTKCGNEIERGMDVAVLQKNHLSSASRMSSVRSMYSSNSSFSSSIYEQKMYSISSSTLISKIEQKSYSSNSSISSANSSMYSLKIHYQNIPEYSSESFASSMSFLRSPIALSNASNNQSGLPWILLFSQSVLWVVLAGKRLL